MSAVIISTISPKSSQESTTPEIIITGLNFTDGGDPVVYINGTELTSVTFTNTEIKFTLNPALDCGIYTIGIANGTDVINIAANTIDIWKLTNTELIRYITDQPISTTLGNNTCHTKASMSLVYDSNGAKGDFGYIMKKCPPNDNTEYEQVYLMYEENFDYQHGGEIKLNNINLIDNDKVWLSNQSIITENGIYYVRAVSSTNPNGEWEFYREINDNVFIDLGVRAYDIVDGDISRQIITDQNINFNTVGFYTINYYILNSQCVISQTKRKLKIIYCNASIVPTDSLIISDYLIKTEIDTSVLNPDNILDSCDACELDDGTSTTSQISNDDSSTISTGNNTTFIRNDGTIKFTESQSMGGNNLTNLQDPTNPTDAVNLRTLEEFVRSSDTIGNNYIAGENLMLHRVVYINTDGKVYNADSSDISQMNKIIGITVENEVTNGIVPVVTIGTINGFTNLNIGNEYFISSSGALTNIPPTTGFTQIMGVAVSNTELLMNMQVPIGV